MLRSRVRMPNVLLVLCLLFIQAFSLPALADSFGAFVYPLGHTRVSSLFGSRVHPVHKSVKHHHGIDLAAEKGTTIRSVSFGQVVFADFFGSYGKLVVLKHKNGLTTHYAHLDSIAVSIGDSVLAGQAIGKVGSSGLSTGPHLHFEIRLDGVAQDPSELLHSLGEAAKG